MAIEPLHALLGILAVAIGTITLIWVFSSLKDEQNLRFKSFLNYFLLGVLAFLLSNLTHILRETVDLQKFLGNFVKLPEFTFLLLGYIILILGVRKISSLIFSKGVA